MSRKKAFTKIISCFFIGIMLFNFGGYLIFFFAQLHQIKAEAIQKIQQGLTSEELVSIEINKQNAAQINWVEKHEFRFSGKMYDVVYSEETSDSTTYYCFDDSKESDLYAALNRVIKRLKNHRKNSTVKIIKVFNHFNKYQIDGLSYTYQLSEVTDFYKMIYKSLPATVSVPPPKCA